jgi:hypothetical protein
MLRNHVTLINDNLGRVPPEAMPQLERLARLAGARFVLREVAHSRSVRRGGSLPVRMKWANVGVGRLLRPHVLRLSLADSTGRVAADVDVPADPRAWLPGEHEVSGVLPVPMDLPRGEYTLVVTLADTAGLRRPFRLAIDAPEREGRYTVSRVTVE